MSTATPPSAERAPAGAGEMTPRPFRVTERVGETRDTWTLRLVPADGGASVVAAPGQFTMLYAFGVGEVPVSVCSLSANPAPLAHTVRAVGAVTEAICATRPGE